MDEIYISGFSEDNKLYLPTVSVITVFIKEYCGTNSFVYRVVSTCSNPAGYPVAVSLESFPSTRLISIEDDEDTLQNAKCWQGKRILSGLCTMLRYLIPVSSSEKSRVIPMEACPECIKNCTLPALRCYHNNLVLSGLCAVLRHILKVSAIQENIPGLLLLLGREETCLKTGAEISLWTKLCEVDMPKAVDQILSKACIEAGHFKVPDELLWLERQLWSLGFKANKNKYVQKASQINNEKSVIRSEQSDVHLSPLKPSYVQGPQITLADIILLPCVTIILNECKDQISWISERLPHTLLWLEKLCDLSCTDAAFTSVNLPKPVLPIKEAKLPITRCKTVAVRRQPKPGKFQATQTDIDHILKKISVLKTAHLGDNLSYDVQLDWQHFPEAVLPKDGLPQEKVKRKCQQLENLVTAVTMMTKPGDVVVDFCSGSGHLGILLAYLLPKCKVVLVENKEESIKLAETKIERLRLKNVTLYQEYLRLAHQADLTHYRRQAAKKGIQCMTYIDLDRAYLAMEYGYTVTLTTLKPRGCSIKSNLIIGKLASY